MLQKVKLFFLSTRQQSRSKTQSKQSNQKTRICKRCFKELTEATFHNLFYKDACLCHKCLQELNPVFNEFKIDKIECINVFWYNDFVKESLYKFKGCLDYELKDTFLDYYNDYFSSKYKKYIMIPAPSSTEAEKARGFNQVLEMFGKIKLPMYCCVHKTTNTIQHNLNSKERADIKNEMIIDNVDLKGKNILIVDDVYTTGSTVKTMIELIKTKHPKKIKVLVMAKTIDLNLR